MSEIRRKGASVAGPGKRLTFTSYYVATVGTGTLVLRLTITSASNNVNTRRGQV